MTTRTVAVAPAAGWCGTTRFLPGLLAFTGATGSTAEHAHAAVQILVVSSGEVELRDAHGARRRVQSAIIPTRARHSLRSDPGTIATMIYLDPAGSTARHLTTRLDDRGRDHVHSWVDTASTGLLSSALAEHRTGVPVGLGDGRPEPVAPPHAALRAAVDLVPQLLPNPVRLTDVAGAVGLSASRLGHLFSAELGLPFPAHLRWVRLRRAAELAQRGAGLTQSAHGAGFSDGSHLTRACREMFGMAPSHLLAAIRRHR